MGPPAQVRQSCAISKGALPVYRRQGGLRGNFIAKEWERASQSGARITGGAYRGFDALLASESLRVFFVLFSVCPSPMGPVPASLGLSVDLLEWGWNAYAETLHSRPRKLVQKGTRFSIT